MESYKGYKKTNMITFEYGKHRRVYICTKDGQYKGKLFYRFNGYWHGTYEEHCKEGDLARWWQE
jgi:hypothetical protein